MRSLKAAGIIQRTYPELNKDTIYQIALNPDMRVKNNQKVKEWEMK